MVLFLAQLMLSLMHLLSLTRGSLKINFKIDIDARETCEVCWMEDCVHVTKSSNVSDP